MRHATSNPLPFKKICIVHKNSTYRRFVSDKKNKNLCRLIRKKAPLIKDMLHNHREHMQSMELIKQELTNYAIKYKILQRTHITSLKGYDLIITIGGDGTFFRTCHHIHNQLILGINSNPGHSVGALCSLKINRVAQGFKKIFGGEFHIKKLLRIKIKINNQTLPVEPINDILLTNISPAATSRYIIQSNKIKEEHKSSGIWIATPSGSTAAINAAGGLKQHSQSTKLQYLIREPYQGIFNPYQLTRGFIKKGEQLMITSKMIKSCLFLDGPSRSYNLEYGDKISFALSDNVLNVISLQP